MTVKVINSIFKTNVLNSLLLHVFWRETKDEVQL
jgi:hypothetical protein